jgi:hypothetical protein
MSNTPPLYNETHQYRDATPTAYENLLGDSIERAFAQGLHEIEPLIDYLNKAGPAGPNSQPWTVETFKAEMARLGA